MLESELSKKLREFIIYMDDTYGEDTTVELAKVHFLDLYDSLNHYSRDRFQKYTPDDILSELIIDELLCDDAENDYVRETKRLVSLKQSAERVFNEVKRDPNYKFALIQSFIARAGKPYKTKVEGIKPKTIEMIQKISTYQLTKKEEQNGKRKVKVPFKKISY